MSEKTPLLDTRLGTRLRQLQQEARAKRRDEIDQWVGRHSTPDGIRRLGASFAKSIEDQASTYENRAKNGEGSSGLIYEPDFPAIGGTMPGTADYESKRIAEFQELVIPPVERILERQFGFTTVKITYHQHRGGYFSLEIIF